MARTITGDLGLNINLTVNDTASATGTSKIVTQTDSAYRNVAYDGSLTKVVSFSGTVGTTAMTFNLSSLNDVIQTSPAESMLSINSSDPVAMSTVYSIMVENLSTSTGTISIANAASSSFLATSEQVTLSSTAAGGYVYSLGKAVTAASNDQFKLTGSAAGISCKMFIVGK